MNAPQARHPVKLIRPAVIEFRFNNRSAYKQQLKLFKRALKPKATEITATDTTCYFPITANPKAAKKELTLRFALLKKKQLGNTRTIVYWEVPADSLQWTSDSMVDRHRFRVLEPIPSKPPGAYNQTLLEATSDQVPLVPNGRDRTLGLVVNPPYPTDNLHGKGTTADSTHVKTNPVGEVGSSPSYFVWIGCVVALLIGFMVGRLGRA